MNLTMFEKMQLLPLFQGLSFGELSEIVEWMKMDFCQFHPNEVIVSQGDRCRSLIFVISGVVCAEYMDVDRRFVLTEELPSSMVLEPYSIYGLYQNYTRSYWMKTEGSGLVIPKNVFNELLRRYQIIRTNYINLICTRLQNNNIEFCTIRTFNIRDKIVKFVREVAYCNKGKKRLKIKMEDLAIIIDETRLNVSRELNKMQFEKKINMRRGVIEFFDFHEI